MKHLIKDNQIIQSGMVSVFTRANGQGFWGGYENMTDLHYEDGWRDEIMPEYNPNYERLGELFYSEQHDAVLREIVPVVINLTAEKSRLYSELDHLRTEMAGVVYQCKLNYDVEPEGLTRLIPIIREMYGFAKAEIEALTEENVRAYVLRSPKYEQLLKLLKTFL